MSRRRVRKKGPAKIWYGRVKNGVVVLDDATGLPEGADVEVSPIAAPEGVGDPADTPTLYEWLKPVFGIAKGLPPDGSTQVDEDLYGR
jgi:hypothetical protein